jgi:hypothetical protein
MNTNGACLVAASSSLTFMSGKYAGGTRLANPPRITEPLPEMTGQAER